MKFRLLNENDIDCRVGQVGNGYYTLLLYKNARVDMSILDETIGSENWQRDHREIKGNLYCGVGIWSESKQQWIWKWDCGTESNTEKEKGEASDSFKRACFCIGIGRELYSAPKIYINCETIAENGKYKIKNIEDIKKSNTLKVSKIGYNDNREINVLVITDNKGNVVFTTEKTPQTKEIVKEDLTIKNQKSFTESKLICQGCGSDVTQKVADYSQTKFGAILCFDCQKKLG